VSTHSIYYLNWAEDLGRLPIGTSVYVIAHQFLVNDTKHYFGEVQKMGYSEDGNHNNWLHFKVKDHTEFMHHPYTGMDA